MSKRSKVYLAFCSLARSHCRISDLCANPSFLLFTLAIWHPACFVLWHAVINTVMWCSRRLRKNQQWFFKMGSVLLGLPPFSTRGGTMKKQALSFIGVLSL